MSQQNHEYLNSGDIVKLPQKTIIWESDNLHCKFTSDIEYAVIIEKTDNQYKILFNDRFCFVLTNQVIWTGV